MTLIVCFNHALVENIAVCLELKPQKLILFGESSQTDPYVDRYQALLDARELTVDNEKLTIQVEPCHTDGLSLSKITGLLADLARKEDTCVIDLTDGDEIASMAVGAMLMQLDPATRQKITVQKYDPATDTITTLMGPSVPAEPGASITPNELIALHGGVVFPESIQPAFRYSPRHLQPMWDLIYEDSPSEWNKRMSTLIELEKYSVNEKGSPQVYIPLSIPREKVCNFSGKLSQARRFLEKLRQHNIVLYTEDRHYLNYRYTDPIFQFCADKAGNLLETKVLLEARKCKENGVPFFTNCQLSVSIDWDGDTVEVQGKPQTRNEIDVVLMKGATPLFVSCKNGTVEEAELYKLCTVTEEFGGPNARKMLVAASLDPYTNKSHRALIRRAKDMGIYPVTNIRYFTAKDWADTFRSAMA